MPTMKLKSQLKPMQRLMAALLASAGKISATWRHEG